MSRKSSGRRDKPLLEKFWPRVRRGADSECWPWVGCRSEKGYGAVVMFGGTPRQKAIAAHRVSWQIHNGPIPDGLLVCHHCDNPPCVNPSHLFLGTNADNMADMKTKGRSTHGVKSHSAKLTLEQVQDIVRLAQDGATDTTVAARYGVKVSAVQRIRSGRGWVRETGGISIPRQTDRVSASEVREIRRLVTEGMSQRAIGEKYGISQTSVWRIASLKAWSEIT